MSKIWRETLTMHDFDVNEDLKKDLAKLSRKSPVRYKAVLKKINEVVAAKDMSHYKNLRAPMQHFKRVHIDSSFVLAFSYDKSTDFIRFTKLKHHDKAYK